MNRTGTCLKNSDDGQRRLQSDSSQSSELALWKTNDYTNEQASVWAIFLVLCAAIACGRKAEMPAA
jgi:hypothetical protein